MRDRLRDLLRRILSAMAPKNDSSVADMAPRAWPDVEVGERVSELGDMAPED